MTPQDLEIITEEVTRRLAIRSNYALSLEEAARVLGLRGKKKSLSTVFSRFSNPEYYNPPLKAVRVGKERSYEMKDLIEFRNRLKW